LLSQTEAEAEKRGIESIKTNAPGAAVADLTEEPAQNWRASPSSVARHEYAVRAQ
jgi:hypothetical protein